MSGVKKLLPTSFHLQIWFFWFRMLAALHWQYSNVTHILCIQAESRKAIKLEVPSMTPINDCLS